MILPPCCTRYFIQQKHVFLAFCKVCHLSPADVNREGGVLKWQTLCPQNTRQKARKTCLCCIKNIYQVKLSSQIRTVFKKFFSSTSWESKGKRGRQVDSLSVYLFSISHCQRVRKGCRMLARGDEDSDTSSLQGASKVADEKEAWHPKILLTF